MNMSQNRHIHHSPCPYKALLQVKSLGRVVSSLARTSAEYLAIYEPLADRLHAFHHWTLATCVTDISYQSNMEWMRDRE